MKFSSAFHQEDKPGGDYRTIGIDQDGMLWLILPGAEPVEFTPEKAMRFGEEMTRLAVSASALADAVAKCNKCAGPASCSEYGRCVLENPGGGGTS